MQTVIRLCYSDDSLFKLREYLTKYLKNVGDTRDFDDVFRINLFLNPNIYAQFKYADFSTDGIPSVLLGDENDLYNKKIFVESTIENLMNGMIEKKPLWMIIAEENGFVAGTKSKPSTYIHIKVIDNNKEYQDLCDKLIDLIYSVKYDAIVAP
ncbi:hypothetical protein EZS27_024865 [termite gut metagenome]|uniref:Uncharacterized protein n=1 Tax=termite gut metagenome TaxID=433724 RepID=A0A5J4QXC1_9ZZZZ